MRIPVPCPPLQEMLLEPSPPQPPPVLNPIQQHRGDMQVGHHDHAGPREPHSPSKPGLNEAQKHKGKKRTVHGAGLFIFQEGQEIFLLLVEKKAGELKQGCAEGWLPLFISSLPRCWGMVLGLFSCREDEHGPGQRAAHLAPGRQGSLCLSPLLHPPGLVPEPTGQVAETGTLWENPGGERCCGGCLPVPLPLPG